MESRRSLAPLKDLAQFGKYQGTFPDDQIPSEENILLEWRPSKALLGKGHPLLAFLMFPGVFSISFTILIPILAFLGVLGFMLQYFYQIGFILILSLIVIVYGSGTVAWWNTFYGLTDEAIYIRTGAFFKRTYRIEFADVIDIKVKRSLFERITGRGTVVFQIRQKRFARHRNYKWYTINNPDIVSASLVDLVFQNKSVRFDDDDIS